MRHLPILQIQTIEAQPMKMVAYFCVSISHDNNDIYNSKETLFFKVELKHTNLEVYSQMLLSLFFFSLDLSCVAYFDLLYTKDLQFLEGCTEDITIACRH